MSLLKKLAGETAIYGMSSILGRLLNYVILTPYLTRVFARDEYGIVTELYSYVALLMVLFTYRMETAFFRFGNQKEDAGRAFSTATFSLIASTIVYSLFFILLAKPIAAWLSYPEHPEYIVWFTLVLAFDTLAAIPFAKLRLDNRPLVFAGIRILNILSNLFFIFFFLEVCPWLLSRGWEPVRWIYNPENRLGYVFLANLLASALTLLPLLPAYLRMRPILDKALLKRMIWYAAPLVISGIAGVINQFIGNPMLKILSPGTLEERLAQVGLFGAAAKIPVLMTLFTQAFNYAAEPFFFRHANREDSKRIYSQVAQAFTLVGSLVFLGIMLYIEIIGLFLGRDFREGLGVVPLLLLAYLFLGIFYSFSIWYKLADRTRIGGFISLGGSAITIVLNIVLIPLVGYYGPGWAALACYGFMAIASYLSGQKYYPIDYPIGKMTLYIGFAVLGYALSNLLRSYLPGNLLLLLAVNTLILIAYFGILIYLERAAIRRMLAQRAGNSTP